MEDIINRIEKGQWEEALELFLEYAEIEKMDERAFIVGATIMEHYDKRDTMLSLITDGLKLNHGNYELYILLGNYYRTINPDQAYLSYENALYYSIRSGSDDDTKEIRSIIDDLKQNEHINVRNVSFAILSFNTLDYTKKCIESIRTTCFDDCYEIVVVDNGSSDGSTEWLQGQKDIILIENKENIGFPAGCNRCIDAAYKDNDIFLLNNDTIVLPNSLFWLRMGLYSSGRVGATGSVTNYAGNGQMIDARFDSLEEYIRFGVENNIPLLNPYELKSFLVMFAMLIRRDAMDKIGVLDERFTPGNYEDDDYGLRLMENGYDCVLCHNSFIFHYGSASFGKDPDKYKILMENNREKIRKKWDFYSDYYTHTREDVIALIDSSNDSGISVLEVGCGLGSTLARIRYLYPNSDVHGIEIVEKIAEIGSRRLDIVCGDIEAMDLGDTKYDYILFPDVLEHLRYPEIVLQRVRGNLKDGGYIIASIPNFMNAAVIHDLLRGNLTYCDGGILDRTHLRFYTLNEIYKMFDRNGYVIQKAEGIIMKQESTENFGEFFDKLLSIEGIASREQFDTYQYLIKASAKV